MTSKNIYSSIEQTNDGYFNFVYQTTNTINNKFYIGVHRTKNLDDGYLGSGKILQRAVCKHGRENFTRTIIKFFETVQEAYEYEKLIVNSDFIKSRVSYNIKIGGEGGFDPEKYTIIDDVGNKRYVTSQEAKDKGWLHHTAGTKVIKLKSGECIRVPCDFNNSSIGEPPNTNTFFCIENSTGKKVQVRKDDPEFLSGKYSSLPCTHNIMATKDNSKIEHIPTSDFRLFTGEYKIVTPIETVLCVSSNGKYRVLKHMFDENVDKMFNKYEVCKNVCSETMSGMLVAKDLQGNIHHIKTDDPRIGISMFHHTKGTVQVIDNDNNSFRVSLEDPRYIDGTLRGVCGGRKYIHKLNPRLIKRVYPQEIAQYIQLGWKIGMGPKKNK